ncbi:MAG: M14 family metallopeptidase, partial [Candidatus Aminicenantales bacterium]
MLRKTQSVLSTALLLLLLGSPGFLQGSEHSGPLTVAESSGFTATSRYADVMRFIRTLQARSPLIRVESLCTSPEGRMVPLCVIGNPPPASPRDLTADGRAAVYIQANIHAGEVEGKEASLMLVRDILAANPPPYLDRLVLLVAPIFNADGNEKISPENRRNQEGPEKGVGVRSNGQNLDLNRDSMKLESPELQGLVQRVLLRWDPVLLVDCHTTNGSPHQEPVTYSWPLNPNGSLEIIRYMREKMMPTIKAHLLKAYNTMAVPYGNFMDFRDPEKGWRTFSHQPRFLTNYIGLRNRLAILNENYAYADFKTRVLGCYNFLRSILDYCAENAEDITALVREADLRTVRKAFAEEPGETFAVEFDLRPLKEKIAIQGWEMEVTPRAQGWPRVRATEKKVTYTLPYYSDFTGTRHVSFPFGYLLPHRDKVVLEKLLEHGLLVEQLRES